MNFFYLLGLSALVAFVKGLEPTVCDRQWVKIGCYKDSLNPRPFPEMLVNDRDPNSKFNDGHVLNWHKWSESIHSLACRCMEKAREKGYTMFALQFYGECWSGPGVEAKYNKDGSAETCIMDLAPPYSCDKEASHECVGAQSTNYVYRIDESQVGTKDVDGGYSEWSEWTKCSKSCGSDGSQGRERTCTNPKPEGKGRPCNPRLGPAEEIRPCNQQPCLPCESAMDVGIIVDSSSSVRRQNFGKVRRFLVEFVSILKKLNTDTHIGLVRYNHKSQLIFNFKEHQDDVLKILGELEYKPGGTRTDIALELSNTELFTAAGGARPNLPHVLLVLTDGKTNSRSKPYRDVLAPLQKKNVRMIAVGVGRNIGKDELTTIAMGHEKKVIQLKDFEDLIKDIKEIEKVFCADEIRF